MKKSITIKGMWDDGIVLDMYIKTSTYLGEDVFGHPQFKNEYSEIGELLHAMKYNGHFDTSKEIVDICLAVAYDWIVDKQIDIVLPIPLH